MMKLAKAELSACCCSKIWHYIPEQVVFLDNLHQMNGSWKHNSRRNFAPACRIAKVFDLDKGFALIDGPLTSNGGFAGQVFLRVVFVGQ